MTEYGPITGIVTHHGSFGFYGIPFAAPPLLSLRWKRPERPRRWLEPIPADKQKDACPQFKKITQSYKGNEDCLYLDVATPSFANRSSNIPVFVWIHGGAWEFGDKSKFDIAGFAAKHDVVVVSMNYRLGVFGSLALEELYIESDVKSTGNYGLMDQSMALQWVHDNIGRFGGDPEQVTLAGESAGAISVCQHLVRSESRNLFQRAIIQSGSCDRGSLLYTSLSHAMEFGREYAESCECSGSGPDLVKCLRRLPVHALMKSTYSMRSKHWPYSDERVPRYTPVYGPVVPWTPVIDGSISGLPEEPLKLLQRESSPIQLLIGSNLDEGSLFVPALNLVVPESHPLTNDTILDNLMHFLPNKQVVEYILEHYLPDLHVASPRHIKYQMAAIFRDMTFACSVRRTANAVFLGNHDSNVYVYQFTFDLITGDYHSSELGFLWTIPKLRLHRWAKMQNYIQSYWANFIKFGSPNTESTEVVWEKYDINLNKGIVLEDDPFMQANSYQDNCHIWDSVYEKYVSLSEEW